MNKIKFYNSIRFKLIMYFLFPVIILILILNIFYYKKEKAILFNEYKKRGKNLVTNLSYSSDMAFYLEDFKMLEKPLEALFIMEENNDLIGVGFYNSQGNLSFKKEKGKIKVIEQSILAEIRKGSQESLIKPLITYKDKEKIMEFLISVSSSYEGTDKDILGYVKVVFKTDELLTLINSFKKTVFLILIVLIGIMFGLSYIISRIFIRPINILLNELKDLAGGEADLLKRLDIKGKDELAELANWFNIFISNLEKLVLSVRNISKKVMSFSENLSSSSEQMSASTEEISSTIQEVAEGINNQANKIRDSREMVEDVREYSNSIAENTNTTTRTYQEVIKVTQENISSIERSIQTLFSVQDVVESVSSMINELSDASQQIGVFVGTIRGIANQTNLLSLNAAIEAARAGEAGKGFNVVAQQVKKLADESAYSSEDVENTIEQVQEKVAAVVKFTAEAKNKVQAIGDISKKTIEGLKSISNAISNSNKYITEINMMTMNQVEKMNLISQAIGEVAVIAEQSAAGVQQTSASTQEQAASMQELAASAIELANIARNLMFEIKKFKISDS